MTPTSYERREVAEALRQMAEKHGAVEASRVAHAIGLEYEVHGTVVAFGSDAVQALADLIDPTCNAELKRVVVDEHYRHTRLIPTCSVCGSPLDGGIGIPRFCPNCGARRVPKGGDA